MHRRSFFMGGLIAFNVVLAGPLSSAWAARLPVSIVTVDVLSVERVSSNREEYKYPGMAPSAAEISSYLAKVRIIGVRQNEHNLNPGSIIEVRYSVRVRQPAPPSFRAGPTLSPGESATLNVFGSGGSFQWQRPAQ